MSARRSATTNTHHKPHVNATGIPTTTTFARDDKRTRANTHTSTHTTIDTNTTMNIKKHTTTVDLPYNKRIQMLMARLHIRCAIANTHISRVLHLKIRPMLIQIPWRSLSMQRNRTTNTMAMRTMKIMRVIMLRIRRVRCPIRL